MTAPMPSEHNHVLTPAEASETLRILSRRARSKAHVVAAAAIREELGVLALGLETIDAHTCGLHDTFADIRAALAKLQALADALDNAKGGT
jgi:hypothetical protein